MPRGDDRPSPGTPSKLPQAIIFDCDGVLLESADIKTLAFMNVFAATTKQVDDIRRYHLANAGVSRFVKFEYIYRHILRRPLSSREKACLARRFAEFIGAKIQICPLVPGAESLIKKIACRVKLFVVSGTPQRELRRILRQRGLADYFHGIYGSPNGKAEWTGRLLRKYGWSPREVLWVGDAMEDWKAARTHGIPFIARVHPSVSVRFPPHVPQFQDLRGLERYWDSRPPWRPTPVSSPYLEPK